ncbi:glycerate kinase [Nocardioides sp. ChNu-153]|uniref:glycerate kinase n=1 Tax=unclassified Nocardioides TaxID=2615069 RepID=UPI002406A55D|nr:MULTISPECIES: glycerate kinase [unclassified Nocardioides]MDF9714563.1 glycerate kinase [Nocardioides sp. ChNu-99]MDN7119904.1 glycerate kinase [Nocardioides sp. ChNu-153]
MSAAHGAPRVVLASDKFKGSLTATDVADALETGLRRRWAELAAAGEVPAGVEPEVSRVPVADGGDGTLDAVLSAGFQRVPVTVTGPLGDPVDTAWARRGDHAVVELADCSGLLRLPGGPTSDTALAAATTGTGEAVAAALAAGCREVLLGLGGSSSTDGGAGLLLGLGAGLGTALGTVLRAGPDAPPDLLGAGLGTAELLGASAAVDGVALRAATHVDLVPVRALLDGRRLVLATDVDNPLLGPDGAAATYGPQKGATPDDVDRLERELVRWAHVLDVAAGLSGSALVPGAGAAGGTGYGAIAGAGATVASGVEAVLGLVGFDDVVAGADLVVTGEGSLDEQSLHGKAPVGVLAAATRAGVPTLAVCGRTTLDPATLAATGFAAVHAVADLQPDPARAMGEAAAYVEVLGARVADALAGRLLARVAGRLGDVADAVDPAS